ncbi:hypothetical protein FHT86_001066 [Rhizobium sp. BK313]|uniref:type IV toxin-antitoxin system AbiEi family antitoxin domain-containing protein n=1 Tax=Rhizobium sp. BK313 TaxID=2587081 RepID=UPI00105BBB48|nr:type IV toxin-antitoxin system AbiEi family antitoxin domain-containing protein [Rhizobium sp. BK313]MBB3452810.1 hypothetical protein [Rhizobium sp. BK313]
MTRDPNKKLRWLLDNVPHDIVVLSSWLEEKGYSPALLRQYRKDGWLETIDRGVLTRYLSKVRWDGMLYGLQANARLPVHVGGRTALAIHGKAQFLELSRLQVTLFAPENVELPRWARTIDWGSDIHLHRTSFLPPDLELIDIDRGNFTIKASSPARAIMEFLYVAVTDEELIEAREIMELLNNLRPAKVQGLLRASKSSKVNRLFLDFAEKAEHTWLKYLNIDKIDLGEESAGSTDMIGQSSSANRIGPLPHAATDLVTEADSFVRRVTFELTGDRLWRAYLQMNKEFSPDDDPDTEMREDLWRLDPMAYNKILDSMERIIRVAFNSA